MVRTALAYGAAAALLPALIHAQYTQVKEYAGDSFFDDWNFYNHADDLTNGNVFFVSSTNAGKDQLAYVNDAGNAIMKVDNTSSVSVGQNRNSVRIETQDHFTVGSLWVTDMLHVPFGCSVWPAFWSSAQDWPSGGEIDTFEGVNQVTMNQMALHTADGCTHSSNALQTSKLINSTDCSTAANNNEGCVVTTPTPSSYGAAFAADGGGVFVTEFANEGVREIWFFNRSSVPSALQSNASTISLSDLGTPRELHLADLRGQPFFQPQSLIFDITLCGARRLRRQPAGFAETCSGVCYDDFVTGPPSTYDNAYFEVKYVRVYGVAGEDTVISAARPRVAVLAGTVVLAALGVALSTLLVL
ncbi:concanavalin A-like lectin/glucanase domain-containing protein [Fomitopsis serialis]|uniref:concanavalin A-like lectin/glucanase domain-containing protein n=1 Tax=Fomitopsis serialis TaxID=139415 RepID=UPI0020079077|nr:concanavalin A-like lectin/glucanase domain-containing protein [Neoantrodia serialis]KAH9919297.1 concanavalin A-like lectin/glucanase domain-containing protein [Neoantrodia serialis]